MFGDVPSAQLTLAGQQSITFNIFGKSNKAIKAAKGALLRLCDDESNTIARQPGKQIYSKRLKNNKSNWGKLEFIIISLLLEQFRLGIIT